MDCSAGQLAPDCLAHVLEHVPTHMAYLKQEFARSSLGKQYDVVELKNAAKYRIAGWLAVAGTNGLLNGLKVADQLPFHSIRKWLLLGLVHLPQACQHHLAQDHRAAGKI